MRHRVALALALLGLPLAAQDITGGLQTGLSLPVGDLKDKTDFGTNQFFGAHIGGHLDFNITSHHQVRAQLTYHSLPGSGWGGPDDVNNDFKILQIGADWVYSFQSPNQGWYTIAGASLNSVKDDYSGNGFSGSASQSGKLGIRGGGGYTFNKMFSLEGSLNQVFVDKNGNDGFGFDTATWVQVSAVFRFGR
ncbi:outer membrane beta-barrel protein [Geothrix alkalitolerans]|uniref:outer membrane beta-barrel protein n=1 Tax=Geothrix alkalitolerans TaxID=2922724 RepID=UPI001FAF6C65|nr:outer membrane beta-barrel protein [Geothrix alkalitolerans]